MEEVLSNLNSLTITETSLIIIIFLLFLIFLKGGK